MICIEDIFDNLLHNPNWRVENGYMQDEAIYKLEYFLEYEGHFFNNDKFYITSYEDRNQAIAISYALNIKNKNCIILNEWYKPFHTLESSEDEVITTIEEPTIDNIFPYKTWTIIDIETFEYFKNNQDVFHNLLHKLFLDGNTKILDIVSSQVVEQQEKFIKQLTSQKDEYERSLSLIKDKGKQHTNLFIRNALNAAAGATQDKKGYWHKGTGKKVKIKETFSSPYMLKLFTVPPKQPFNFAYNSRNIEDIEKDQEEFKTATYGKDYSNPLRDAVVENKNIGEKLNKVKERKK